MPVNPFATCICSIFLQKSFASTRSDSPFSGGTSKSSTKYKNKSIYSNSSNTRLRTLKILLEALEMPVKSEVAYLNVLQNLNVHSKISKVLEPGNISKALVFSFGFRNISKVLVFSSNFKVLFKY